MIPEEGSYEVLKAVIETCPALPAYWQPELDRRFKSFMAGLRWLSLTEGHVKGKLIYVAYADGCTSQYAGAKQKVAEEVQKLGGWLFDWNGAPGHESIFNFGIAMPRLLDGQTCNPHRHVEDL